MRLSAKEVKAIKATVLAFDPNANIFVYGSRANENLSGGDIDLLVISEKINFPEKIKILSQIKEQIGEQKIDLLVKSKDNFSTDSFILSIKNTLKPLN